MTETNWVDEEYRASDLWCVEKSLTPLGDEGQRDKWRQAAELLRDLGRLAETLRNDPLLLALTDALVRAEEELGRVEDRLARADGEALHPRERQRLQELLDRGSALANAHYAVWDGGIGDEGLRAKTLGILKEMMTEAEEAFERYRSEVGIRSS